MDSRLLGSSVHGILQARTPEWVVIPFSRGFSQQNSFIERKKESHRFKYRYRYIERYRDDLYLLSDSNGRVELLWRRWSYVVALALLHCCSVLLESQWCCPSAWPFSSVMYITTWQHFTSAYSSCQQEKSGFQMCLNLRHNTVEIFCFKLESKALNWQCRYAESVQCSSI